MAWIDLCVLWFEDGGIHRSCSGDGKRVRIGASHMDTGQVGEWGICQSEQGFILILQMGFQGKYEF